MITKIIGIDPGLRVTGYGVITEDRGDLALVEYDVVRTNANQPVENRLRAIFDGMNEAFEKHRPDACAIESLFYAKNPKSTFQLGQARGVLVLCASLQGVPVYEYTPLEVKQAVAGYGRADKKQVQYMTRTLLKLKEAPSPADAADALAIAICHSNSIKMQRLMGKK